MYTTSKRGWAIAAVGATALVFSTFYRSSVTVIATQLAQDLGLDSAQLSDVSAAFFYAFALCQFPLGLAMDRVGVRTPITILLALGAVGALVFATAEGITQAVIGRVLMGISMSGAMMGPLVLMANWFSRSRFATVAGLISGTGSAGLFAAATPLALAAQSFGWRTSFVMVGVLNLALAAVFWLLVRDHPPGAQPLAGDNEKILAGFKRLVRMRSFWVISWAAFVRYGCAMVLQGLWAGPFLIAALGYSQIQAGNILLIFSCGYVSGLYSGGYLTDRWLNSRKKLVIPVLAVFSLCFLLMGGLEPGMSIIWPSALFLLMGYMGGSSQIIYPHIKDLAPSQNAASAMTGINFFTMMGPGVGIHLAGYLLPDNPDQTGDAAAYLPVWLMLAGFLAFTALLYLTVPDSKPQGEPSHPAAHG